MITTRFTKTTLAEPGFERRIPRIRTEQYDSLLKLRLAYEKVMLDTFDKRLGIFAARVMGCELQAREFHQESKANEWRKENKTLTDADFDKLLVDDAELAKAMHDRGFKKFLALVTMEVLDPRLYKWNTLGDVVLLIPGQVCPATNKQYPKIYGFFIDWYIFGSRFVDGKMLPKSKPADSTVPSYALKPSNPDNYALIHKKAFENNMEPTLLRFYKNNVEYERPMAKFSLGDMVIEPNNAWWRHIHKNTANPHESPVGKTFVELPDPWWCEIDLKREDFMATIQVKLRLTQNKNRADKWGIRIDPQIRITIPYRVTRPISDEFGGAAPPSDDASLFMDEDEINSVPSSSEDLFTGEATAGTKHALDGGAAAPPLPKKQQT